MHGLTSGSHSIDSSNNVYSSHMSNVPVAPSTPFSGFIIATSTDSPPFGRRCTPGRTPGSMEAIPVMSTRGNYYIPPGTKDKPTDRPSPTLQKE